MKTLYTVATTILLSLASIAGSAQSIFDKNFTGTQKEYFADGKPKYEISVVKGKKQGLETFWYASGKLYIQTHYLDDKEDGVWQQWYESGQLKLAAHYKRIINV